MPVDSVWSEPSIPIGSWTGTGEHSTRWSQQFALSKQMYDGVVSAHTGDGHMKLDGRFDQLDVSSGELEFERDQLDHYVHQT